MTPRSPLGVPEVVSNCHHFSLMSYAEMSQPRRRLPRGAPKVAGRLWHTVGCFIAARPTSLGIMHCYHSISSHAADHDGVVDARERIDRFAVVPARYDHTHQAWPGRRQEPAIANAPDLPRGVLPKCGPPERTANLVIVRRERALPPFPTPPRRILRYFPGRLHKTSGSHRGVGSNRGHAPILTCLLK